MASWFHFFSPTILSHGFCILFPEETAPAKKTNKQTKKNTLKNSIGLVGVLSFYYLFICGCAGSLLLCAGCLELWRVGEEGLLFLSGHGLLIAVASLVELVEHAL